MILCLVSAVGTDGEWLIKYATGVGVGCLVLAMIFSNAIRNAIPGGSHMRGPDTAEDQNRRNRWSTYLLLAALPNIIGAIVVYSYLHS